MLIKANPTLCCNTPGAASSAADFLRSAHATDPAASNFDRPSTPQTWPRSTRNFAKTRFRRFPSIQFLLEFFFCFGKIFGLDTCVSPFYFRLQKIKCWESSETRFGKVSRRSEPSSRGKRPFKVSKKSTPKISNGRKIARMVPILTIF